MAKRGFFPTINRKVVILNTCKQGHSWHEVSLNIVFGGRLSGSLLLLTSSLSQLILSAAHQDIPTGYSHIDISFRGPAVIPFLLQPHHLIPTLCCLLSHVMTTIYGAAYWGSF